MGRYSQDRFLNEELVKVDEDEEEEPLGWGAYEKGWDGAAKVFGCCFFLCFYFVSNIQHFVSLLVVGKIMFLFHTFSVSFCGGQGLLERFTWSELEMFRFPSPCLGTTALCNCYKLIIASINHNTKDVKSYNPAISRCKCTFTNGSEWESS